MHQLKGSDRVIASKAARLQLPRKSFGESKALEHPPADLSHLCPHKTYPEPQNTKPSTLFCIPAMKFWAERCCKPSNLATLENPNPENPALRALLLLVFLGDEAEALVGFRVVKAL